MPFEFGDVVLVPFPFTNQAASKKRPAVIVSSKAYNLAKPDVILMAITSQFRPHPELGEVWLAQWEQAGLVKPSAIKPLIATLEQALISAASAHWGPRTRRSCARQWRRSWDKTRAPLPAS